ncbi:MAG: signal transduction histidine kinase, partial [Paraglaciecola sp.]
QLVPAVFHADHKVFRPAKLILKIDALIFLAALFFIPFFYAIGFIQGYWVMTFAIICAVIFPLLLNFTEDLEKSGQFFAFSSITVFSSLIYLTGGVHSPYLVWLLTVPPITVLYMRSRSVYTWLSILSFIMLFFFGLEISGKSVPNYQPMVWFAPTLLFSFVTVVAICLAVVRLLLNGFRSFNKKLKASNKSLQESNKELERFAYIASHDLKSPLRNIVSFVNLIERRYSDRLDEDGNDYLKIVKTNARQMHHLVEDILEYSQTNKKEFQREKVDLVKILLEITTQLQSNEGYVPSEVLFDKIPLLNADAATINQLFRNLIENGLKYNDKDLPAIRIKFLRRKKQLYFKVSDNGIGIEQEYQKSIFEMFRRLHNQSTYRGTGIGLAICKKIVDLYDGRIWVTSKKGKGSTFHIVFPETMLADRGGVEEKEVVMESKNNNRTTL